jgi:hypothetical protein
VAAPIFLLINGALLRIDRIRDDEGWRLGWQPGVIIPWCAVGVPYPCGSTPCCCQLCGLGRPFNMLVPTATAPAAGTVPMVRRTRHSRSIAASAALRMSGARRFRQSFAEISARLQDRKRIRGR